MKASPSRTLASQAFNALEMLIVLAVIGTVAALVVPQFTAKNGTAGEETPVAAADSGKDRANAQNIVSMWSAVAALGGKLPTTKEGCIDALVNGIDVPFAGGSNHYQLTGMGRDDVAAASRFISFSSAGAPRLTYHPEGGQ